MATKQRTLVKATLIAPNAKREASQPSTPLCGAGSLVAFQVNPETGKREPVEAVTVRTYFNERGNGMQPVRACVWVKSSRGSGAEWRSGRGSASGCGYHKESAAIAEAVEACGVQLWGSPYTFSHGPVDFKKRVCFGGTGSSAYENIFKAIAKAAGFKGPMMWVSHGL